MVKPIKKSIKDKSLQLIDHIANILSWTDLCNFLKCCYTLYFYFYVIITHVIWIIVLFYLKL